MSGNGNGHGGKMDDDAVYGLLQTMAAQLIVMQRDIQTMQRENAQFRAEVKREFIDVRHDIATLRQDVATYHGSVMGHGILITELDERIRLLEGANP